MHFYGYLVQKRTRNRKKINETPQFYNKGSNETLSYVSRLDDFSHTDSLRKEQEYGGFLKSFDKTVRMSSLVTILTNESSNFKEQVGEDFFRERFCLNEGF